MTVWSLEAFHQSLNFDWLGLVQASGGKHGCGGEMPAAPTSCPEASISQLFFLSAGPLPFCVLFHEDSEPGMVGGWCG